MKFKGNTVSGVWTTATLSQARWDLAAAATGTKVMFGGGFSISAVVDIYDTVSGVWATTTLSVARYGLAAAATGTKLLFGGGVGGSTSRIVDICMNVSAAK